MATRKAEETGQKILDAALELFRDPGFEQTTRPAIAGRAGVATGAAYYYSPSKDAIVLAFYERSCTGMQPRIAEALERVKGLEASLRALIRVKLEYFAPNRGVLRALLKNGADPRHPISPFSAETKAIRDIDLVWFASLIEAGGVHVPRSEEHTSELQSHSFISYAVFCLKKKNKKTTRRHKHRGDSACLRVCAVSVA